MKIIKTTKQMKEKIIYFENNIFIPASDYYTTFDKELLSYDIDSWKSISDVHVLLFHCNKGGDMLRELEIVKNEILSICGDIMKDLLAEASIGDVNIINASVIGLTDGGFLDKKIDAIHEIAYQIYHKNVLKTPLVNCDFSHTYLDYN